MIIKLVFNDSIDKIGDWKQSPIFHLIDMNTVKGRKEGFKLKSHWGAKLNPFAIVYQDDIPVKAFYSESGKDVLDELLNYLQTI